jgi:ABC-2 type transport system permease protein
MPGAGTVYRWELRKLLAQKRTYLGIGIAIAMPILFVVALQLQSGSPEEVVFGRYVRDSALAIPLVLLVFGSVWLFPLITALVAGDIFASEDHNGTLKTILTRSLDRGQIFAGKALAAVTYAVVALLLMAVVAVVAGSIVSGLHPLVTLSGETVRPGRGLVLVGASLAVYALPLLAIACIGLLLSAATRNSAGAVVGTLMVALILQLLGILPGLKSIQPYLLPSQFDAWQGLLRTPIDWAPVTRAAWVCSLYGVPSLFAAYLVFLRRDVAGG